MNSFLASLIIAMIQGITEWLPVSSSGHLVLAERILNYDSHLMFDVALHFGTLMSVFVYFGRDISNIFEEVVKLRFDTENGKLGLFILISCIPAGIVGFLFKDVFEGIFYDLRVVAIGFGVTGLLLIVASLDLKIKRKDLNVKDSFFIGLAQIFSIFPGVSRSGTTITASLFSGLDEKKALRFAFLMSIPVIFGANLVVIGNQKLPKELIWATLVAFVFGLISINLLYKRILTTRKNLRWFGIYALLLSIVLNIILFF